MAGLFDLGGSSAHTDRNQQLQSWKDLGQLFGYGASTGMKQSTAGGSALGSSIDYFKSLMSGDRAKMANVLAPQISTIRSQAQQQKETASQFGNRSGGTNAAIQASENEANNAVQQLFEMLGPMAAQEVGQLGATQEQLGQGLLDLAGTSAAEIGKQATDARETDLKIQQQQQAAIIQGLLGLASMGTNAATGGAGFGGFGEGKG